MGTLDSNGHPANSVGSVRFDVVPGTGADVRTAISITDVRNKSNLSDYTGELQETAGARITDRLNGPSGDESGTVVDLPFPATVPCAATADTGIGATCSLATSFNTLVPGVVVENKRAIWQLGQIQLFDGGPDGVVSTSAGNSLFADQGIFAP